LDPNIFFELSQTHTTGHSLKLIKPRCRLDIRKFSFAHSIIDVDVWNGLDVSSIACDSINSLKIESINFAWSMVHISFLLSFLPS